MHSLPCSPWYVKKLPKKGRDVIFEWPHLLDNQIKSWINVIEGDKVKDFVIVSPLNLINKRKIR